jgi:hypothetical protein
VTTEVYFDAEDFLHMSRAIGNLPGEIKSKAFANAMRRMTEMTKTRVIRESAERTDLPPSRVRRLTTAAFNSGDSTMMVVMRAGWVPLSQLGPRQTATGVSTRYRGKYPHAFIANMKSGHTGVFINTRQLNSKSQRMNAIRELFGPNPAHDVTNNPDEFIKVMASVIQDHLAPRVLHEIGRLLPG